MKHEDVFAKFVDIKINAGDIIDKINAFDWLDLSEANSERDFEKVVYRLFNLFNFQYPKQYDSAVKKAFSHLMAEAITKIKESITAVSGSYNIEGSKSSFKNAIVDKFYYIEYWANKKNIPVNYNEKNQDKRGLFNFDTIILSILSDKLRTFNEFEQNKPKK